MIVMLELKTLRSFYWSSQTQINPLCVCVNLSVICWSLELERCWGKDTVQHCKDVHRIHRTCIFTYICHKKSTIHVCKYTSPMDPMGNLEVSIFLLHTGSLWLLQHRFVLSSARTAIAMSWHQVTSSIKIETEIFVYFCCMFFLIGSC